jgi:hypothetical protein
MFRRSLLLPSCNHMRRHIPHAMDVANTRQEYAKHRGPQIQQAHHPISINYRHSEFYAISNYTIPDLRNLKLKVTTLLKCEPIPFLVLMKAQWNKSGGWILLGDNTGDRAVTQRQIRTQHVGVWMEIWLPLGIHIYSWQF